MSLKTIRIKLTEIIDLEYETLTNCLSNQSRLQLLSTIIKRRMDRMRHPVVFRGHVLSKSQVVDILWNLDDMIMSRYLMPTGAVVRKFLQHLNYHNIVDKLSDMYNDIIDHYAQYHLKKTLDSETYIYLRRCFENSVKDITLRFIKMYALTPHKLQKYYQEHKAVEFVPVTDVTIYDEAHVMVDNCWHDNVEDRMFLKELYEKLPPLAQRILEKLYCGYSYAEIARQENVSRQAIHDYFTRYWYREVYHATKAAN